MIDALACPRDHLPLEARDGSLACEGGHRYPLVDEIPVLVVDDAEPTQPGYWSRPRDIERVRAEVPPPVAGDAVDSYVERLIVGTHGNLYRHVGRLPRYPIPRFPLSGTGALLDIGCNWGRWSLAAARAGHDVTGLDPSFEAIVAARRIAEQLRKPVRYVVGDARYLPFPDAAFDVVFSYSVLQHFSKSDVAVAVHEIARVLRPGGISYVQMPNTVGVRNLYQRARRGFREARDFDVRYWRVADLRRVFGTIGPTTISADGFFTLNPRPEDLDLLAGRHAAVVRVSGWLRRVPGLTRFADSLYVRSERR